MTTPRLALPELLQDTKSGYVTFNDLGRILDSTLSLAVQQYALVDPPGTPSDGQCWYVPSGATGDWTGEGKKVAQWFNGAWYFRVPEPGSQIYLLSDDVPGYIDANGDVVLIIPPDTPYKDLILSDSPLAYWPLDDLSGPTILELISGNNGNLTGTYTLSEAPLIQERSSIAVTSAHMTASIGASGDTYTLEAWIKPTGAMGGFHIVMHEPGIGFYITGNRMDFYFGGSHLADTTLIVGQTYHCVLVVTAGSGVYYLNGVPDGSASGCPAFNPVNFFGSGGEPLIAGVDEFAFYQTALTAQQVLDHYNAGTP